MFHFVLQSPASRLRKREPNHMRLRLLMTLACCSLLSLPALAQMQMDKPGAPPASPPATASVTLNGKAITIKYNSPSQRGRKIMGGVVPYSEVWRTGANPAT